jgi:Kef-type K+ transport system membrane component KefB/nucleotide-binding universal stress UspA family protein
MKPAACAHVTSRRGQGAFFKASNLGAAVLITALLISAALAAENKGAPSEVVFLGQLVLLMLVGRLLGEALSRVGQPSVMGMLLGGILLGPSALGLLLPDVQQAIFPRLPEQKAMLDGIAQFGILLLLLLTGMETDLKLVRKVAQAAFSVSLTGVTAPFICGFTLGQFLPESVLPNPGQRLLTSLFLGTALSISSIKIVAAIVREMGFARRNLGQTIVASAICEDSIGWVIIAVIFGLAEAGTINLASVAKSVIGTAIFLIASFTVGRRVVFLLIRWANDHFESDFPVVTTILVIMGLLALTTHFIGVHTVLGAFVAGVLVGQSPILSRHIDEQLRGLILAFFMPVFFGIAGLSADLTVLADPPLALMAVGVVAVASIGKFAGAFIGAKLGGLTRREALALGCGMNARGSTEVIIASIGLSMGALSQNLYTVIVAMALITTLAMPPMLRWSLARVPMRKAEKERLEREESEAKQFIPNIERLLLAVDQSPNGRFAARLAGLIAGPREIATTVLPLDVTQRSGRAEKVKAEHDHPDTQSAGVLKAAAETTRQAENEEAVLTPVEVMVRKLESPRELAVASEAKKGYDLLFVGIENTRTRSGEFQPELGRIVSAFGGPVALVAGQNLRPEHLAPASSILVPVTGNEVSRRAAELAIAVARACNCSMTALYAANPAAIRLRRLRGNPAARAEARAILDEVAEMADRQDLKIRTAVHTEVVPHQAILMEAKRSTCDLLIMGVSRRPGDKLFFGDTAAAVFKHAPSSIVFLTA